MVDFNYDTSNDTNGSMVVAKTDRSRIIGAAIPSGMVVAMIDLQPLGFIGVSGGIVREELNDVRRVIKTYWRQVF